MRTGQTKRTGSRATAAVLAAALALALAGCGSGGAKSRSASATSSTTPVSTATGGPAAPQDPTQVLATIKGPDGIVLTINSAKRETGGFVTVTGTVKNTGGQPFSQAGSWRGDEEELQKNGGSLAGATLVDTLGKKRYYVLRDTEGRCLCSTGLDIIQPGATMPVFAQFPAPPATTTQVDFDLPTLPTASIVISQ